MTDYAAAVAAAALASPDGQGITAGVLLRRAREAAGLHTEALAAHLKVPVQKIEALEADRLDLLPDLVFVRGLASSICRTLGVDPEPVLERLPRKLPPRLAQDRDHVNAPFRGPNDVAGPGWRDQLMRPAVLAVLALLLGAVTLILLPQSMLDNAVAVARASIQDGSARLLSSTMQAAEAPAPSMIVEQTAAPAVNQEPQGSAHAVLGSGSDGAVVPSVLSSSRGGGAPGASAQAAARAFPTTASQVAPPVAGLASAGVLVFRTTGESWVEVRDAQGVVALRRMLAAGETVDASGTPPLSVTVGKSDVTEVQVRGRAFDLTGVSRDNVARFQVQ